SRVIELPDAIDDDDDRLAAAHRVRQCRRSAADGWGGSAQGDRGATVNRRRARASGSAILDREFIADTRWWRAWVAVLAMGKEPAAGLLHRQFDFSREL